MSWISIAPAASLEASAPALLVGGPQFGWARNFVRRMLHLVDTFIHLDEPSATIYGRPEFLTGLQIRRCACQIATAVLLAVGEASSVGIFCSSCWSM